MSTAVWHLADPARFDVFRRVTEATPMPAGVGLPGRVLARGRPEWMQEIATNPVFVRSEAAGASGLRSGFAFPVLVGSEVTAVLEFFTPALRQPDADLVEAMRHIGAQLGRVIERALTKDVDGSEQLSAIRAVSRGRTYVQYVGGHAGDPGAQPDVLRRPAADTSRPLLSPREQQVLALLAHGYTNRAVAERLSLSVKTIETYRARLGEKLGLRNRADLVRFAIELGLLTPGHDPHSDVP